MIRFYRFILFIISLLFISCNIDGIEKKYYPNGNLKMKAFTNEVGEFNGLWEEYYETGELLFSAQYKNGYSIGTAKYYYKNKNLMEEGKLTNQLKSGWWKNYSSSGILTKDVEYVIINKKPYINQYIAFDRKGDTIFNQSSYLKIYIPDTLSIGKNIGRIKYHSDISTKDKFYLIIIDNQISENRIARETFPEEPKTSRSGSFAHKKGKKEIRGVVDENYFEIEELPNDSLKAAQIVRKIYFRKNTYVK